jgi:hypothetical protein
LRKNPGSMELDDEEEGHCDSPVKRRSVDPPSGDNKISPRAQSVLPIQQGILAPSLEEINFPPVAKQQTSRVTTTVGTKKGDVDDSAPAAAKKKRIIDLIVKEIPKKKGTTSKRKLELQKRVRRVVPEDDNDDS